MTAAQLADLLHARRTAPGKWQAKCPGHKDRVPSLSIATGQDGRILLKCHAGCRVETILAAKGLRMSDLYSSTRKSPAHREPRPQAKFYDYHDAEGKLLYRVYRKPGKQFRQCRPDGNGGWLWNLDGVKRVLYNLPAVLKAEVVLVAEGEKDADTLNALHLENYEPFRGHTVAPTTNSGGAGKWNPADGKQCAGKDVFLFEDNDDAGRAHAQDVLHSVHQHANTARLIRLPDLPPKGDVSDWMLGHTVNDLLAEIARAPQWQPEPDATMLAAEAEAGSQESVILTATGAELIRQFEELFKRYIVASRGVALVGALYAFMTHCFRVFSWIGYLCFYSPAEGCGKSHAADIVGWAAARPEILVSVTEAALFRLITELCPTVVIDEAEVLTGAGDTAKALRAVLHAGNAPDDTIPRCAPNTHKLERFSPWCPKIFCLIGNLPRTLQSRCICIHMKRKSSSEKAKAFIRGRVKPELIGLGAEIAAWVQAHEAEIQRVYESLPDESFCDRGGENFAPLEAILTVSDPARLPEFRQARFNLMNASNAEREHNDISIRLFLDIKKIFGEKRVEELASTTLVEALAAIEESPWAEWSRGKPLSATKLAALLRPFQIFPGQIENGQRRGYKRSDLQECFDTYLPGQGVKVSETQYSCWPEANFEVSNGSTSDTLKSAISANNDKDFRHFDTLKAGMGDFGPIADLPLDGTIFASPASTRSRSRYKG